MRHTFTALLIACSMVATCCTQSAPQTAVDEARKQAAYDQYARLVKIVSTCKYSSMSREEYGSGVRIGGTVVLTAHHVVICHLRDDEGKVTERGTRTALEVRDLHDNKYPAAVEGSSETDIARLNVPDLPSVSRVQIAASDVADWLCIVFAAPELGRRCGELWPSKDASVTGGMLIDYVAEHGNSGSGVWNRRGELVGILVHLRWCQGTEDNRQVCTAGATALAPRRWLAAP